MATRNYAAPRWPVLYRSACRDSRPRQIIACPSSEIGFSHGLGRQATFKLAHYRQTGALLAAAPVACPVDAHDPPRSAFIRGSVPVARRARYPRAGGGQNDASRAAPMLFLRVLRVLRGELACLADHPRGRTASVLTRGRGLLQR